MLKLGRRDEALEELDAALEHDPRCYTALKVRGAAFSDDGDLPKAEKLLRAAHEIRPDEPEGLCLLSKVLLESNRSDEAVPLLKRAIKVRPLSATGFSLMGAVYRSRCRFKTAFSFYRHALRLEPKEVATNVNYAVGLMDTGRVHEAIAQYQHYLEIDPGCDQARFNLSTALLQIGRLKEGWEAYEARRKMHKLRDHTLPYADWMGEPLAGKTILILAEQGIGDEIWAASMFDDVIQAAGHCLIECDSRLVGLYSRSFPTATILPRLPDAVYVPKEFEVDFSSLGMSLARWLRTEWQQFPGKLGYLVPDPQRLDFWRWRLAQLGSGLKVGISWRSMNIAGTRNDSYTALEQWGDILSVPGAHFINLQYGKCQEELDAIQAATGFVIHNFKDIDLKDGLEDVAALMSELDLVIAPDNTVSAMAGAMNIPVLQFVPSKYWNNHGREYHPWYPSAQLFFRPWDHTWTDTLRALSIELTRRSRQGALECDVPGIDVEVERNILRGRISRGTLFLHGKKPERARDIFREILSARPNYSDALLLLGVAENELGNTAEAERVFVQAIQLDALLADAHNQLGALYLASGRFDLAAASFEKALEIRPGFPDALSNLGNTFVARHQLDAAIDCYQRAIATQSGFLIARYNLAMAFENVGRTKDALTEYETVVDGNSHHADAWNNLGGLYARLGRIDDATAAYRRALFANPDLLAAKVNLAKALLTLGNAQDEAIELLEAVVVSRTEDARLANTLGAAYASKGDMEKAQESFQRAIDLQSDYADAYRNLGVALQKLGRLDDARDVLVKGLALAVEKGHSSTG
jgi:tetratricopeptide (TPR) repeat protein